MFDFVKTIAFDVGAGSQLSVLSIPSERDPTTLDQSTRCRGEVYMAFGVPEASSLGQSAINE